MSRFFKKDCLNAAGQDFSRVFLSIIKGVGFLPVRRISEGEIETISFYISSLWWSVPYSIELSYQPAQDVLQDAAVAVVVDFDLGVKPQQKRNLLGRAVRAVNDKRQILMWVQILVHPF